jgi:Ca2+-binding RTX toxin-like protein
LETGEGIEVLEARHMLSAVPAIGMNLESVSDFSTAWPFMDAFATSRPWFSQGFNVFGNMVYWNDEGLTGAPDIQMDANGFPTALQTWTDPVGQTIEQRLGTLMFRDIGDQYPGGVYYAEWEGVGELSWGFAATEQGEVQALGNNRYGAEVLVDPSIEGGIYLRVDSIDINNPIRDLHLWIPTEAGSVATRPASETSSFHPFYTAGLEPFETLRFLNWSATNRSTLVEWSDRPTLDSARQTEAGRGVAFEYMIELANQLQQDLWINLPHQANDDFITQMATLFRDTVDPELKIRIEWSNEIWNFGFGFDTARWLQSQTELATNAGRTMYQVAADEMARDFAIWSDVFAGQTARIDRVVAGQAANVDILHQVLSELDGQFDSLAVSAYIDLTEEQRWNFQVQQGATGDVTADSILDAGFANLATTLEFVQDHQTLAASYASALGRDIALHVYEGGQHFDGRGNANLNYLPALYAAQESPRMAELYSQLLKGLQPLGTGVFAHYEYISPNSHFGSWGSLQHQQQAPSTSPKYTTLVAATEPEFFNTLRVDAVYGPSEAELGDVLRYNAELVGVDHGSAELSIRWVIYDSSGELLAEGTGTAAEYQALAAGELTVEFTVIDGTGASATGTLVTIVSLPDGPTAFISNRHLFVIGTEYDDRILVMQNDNTFNVRINRQWYVDLPITEHIYVAAKAGNDIVTISNNVYQNATIYAGDGNDRVAGGRGYNTLFGEAGNDRLYGNWADNDRLFGGAGDDVLAGFNGADLLNGGDGDDIIAGGYGDDLILAGAGDDIVSGGPGADTIELGLGRDLLVDNHREDIIYDPDGNAFIWWFRRGALYGKWFALIDDEEYYL